MTLKTFQKGAGKNKLTRPITREQLRELEPCTLASPRVGKHHGTALPAELMNNDALLASAQKALDVRKMALAGEFPRAAFNEYYPGDWGDPPETIPDALAGEGLSFDNPLGLAAVVHMDAPDDLGRVFRDWLLSEGYVHKDANLDCVDFLAHVPQSNREMAAAAEVMLDKAFDEKCWFLIPRPEEMIPGEKTHYPEGSPSHGSFPQGHAAAAVGVIVNLLRNFRAVVDGKKVPLPDSVKKQGLDCAYVWQFGRVIAWVHYLPDGVAYLPRWHEV